jgi:hypothetical protein
MASYTHSCDYPYEDAGKPCTDSGQCAGRCTVPEDYVRKNWPNTNLYISGNLTCADGDCNGTCAAYPLRFCQSWIEVNNGTIEPMLGPICD